MISDINNINNSLKRKIMARVCLEYGKNAVLEYPDYFMLGLFMVATFMFVSVRHVIINLTGTTLGGNLPGIFNFLLAALRNTSWVIQLLIAGFFVRVAVSGVRLAYKNLNAYLGVTKFRY